MKSVDDLVIIGAGVAGCAAAIAALQNGMSVSLLEIQAAPRVQPGETLHPGVETIFRQLGLWESLLAQKFHRHRGIWRESLNGNRVFAPYGRDADGPWLGFQVDRAWLNEMLRSRVADLGGIISRVAHLDRAVVDVSAVSGICADGRYHQARCVMDATGRRAWLAKKLGLDADTLPLRQRLSFGWSTEVPAELDGQPNFREVSSGWDWVAPVGNGRSSWARLRRSSASGGIEYPWRIFRDCAGFGYFLLGDAASLMDPSAANGVLRAMMSGIYSSHLMRCMNTGTKSWRQAIVEYKRWIGQMFDAAAAARSISLAQ